MNMVTQIQIWETPCSIVANMLDCDIVVSGFKLQLCYYIHFQNNTLGKGLNPLIRTSII